MGKRTHQTEKLLNEGNSYRIKPGMPQGDGRMSRAVLEAEPYVG